MAPAPGKQPKPKEAIHRHRYFQCLSNILAAALICILLPSGTLMCNASRERSITIPALKRTAQLGDLYDEKRDNLIPVVVFSRNIPKEFINEIENPYRRSHTEITESLIDQFNFFGITKNTGVNILTGITKPKGALSILKGKGKFSQMTGSLFYEYETVVQTLQCCQDGLKDNYNKKIMEHKDATHVVTRISWGSQVAVQVHMKPDSITNQTDTRPGRKLLKAELRNLRVRGQLTPSDELPSNFYITVSSDIPVFMETPTTRQQVKEMLSQVPALVANINGGKGVPLSYSLTPINQIREHLGVTSQNTTAHQLNEFTLNEIIEAFQNMNSAEVQLGHLNDRIKTYPNCVPQETATKLIDLQSKFRNFKSNFTTTVKNALNKVRLGLGENTILSDTVDQFIESDFEPGNMRLQVKNFDKDLEKIKFCRNFQNKFTNVKYFGAVGPEGQEEDLVNMLNEIENNSQIPIFILLTKFECIQKEPGNYNNKFGLVLTKMNGTNSPAAFVDCDYSHPYCANITDTIIYEYRNGSMQIFEAKPTEDFGACSQRSCLNGGTCIMKDEDSSCKCAAGFIGESCEDIECALPGTCNSAVTVTKPSSCKCRPGYVKDSWDPAKCQSSTGQNATLLFIDSDGIQQLSISQRNTTRIVSDFFLQRALDYHYRDQTIFWSSTGGQIYSAPISAGASKTLVISDPRSSIFSIAIDWIHDHLYYASKQISVANLDGSMRKDLINDGLEYPSSIVVNPSNGWMYWLDHRRKKIERAGMDGSRRQTIATATDSPWGLAIDYTENRLYWTTVEPHPCSIYSMNTDGSDQKLVLRAAAPNFRRSNFHSIAVFEDLLYWRDDSTNKMYRANKCNGEELTELIAATGNHKEVKVYHSSKQPEFTNQCARRTQQCSRLCLPIPGIGNATLSTICA